jgi:hypothetical protein
MTLTLSDRLNEVLPRVTDKGFLSSAGIGNEIACYIFDYSPADELKVRDHVSWMMARLASHHKDINAAHFNLLDVVLAYLKERGVLEKTLAMQATKGDGAVLKALRGPLTAERVRDFMAAEYAPQQHDLVLLSGVGSVWPMLRAHSLLNCLHTVMDQTPLVMFYPGTFDGTTLRLFDRIVSPTSKGSKDNYYRAFTLVPREAHS